MNSNRVKYLIQSLFQNSKLNREPFLKNKSKYQLIHNRNKTNAYKMIQKRQFATFPPHRPDNQNFIYILLGVLGLTTIRIIRE